MCAHFQEGAASLDMHYPTNITIFEVGLGTIADSMHEVAPPYLCPP